ncbi:aromatic-ring-hydroxylating dioxygenase subunit beta [Pigmentiphaga sp. YJ18]|uniref:aromatic-ring-hydroxylating dioxygenase subunit beta n=1 Tax=Pigmentiphaga sp. YJ18 TaxID=3134907 RepID=UPI003114EA6F
MVPSLQARVERFNYDYADALDQRRYAEWPDFFTADACDYRVVSRENHDAGLPAPLMGCYSHGMVKDRVTMLIKGTLTYRDVNFRHYITNVRADETDAGAISASANFLVMQSDLEGNASVYMVGRYEDQMAITGDRLRLRRRLVIVDSFSIDNMLAVPL